METIAYLQVITGSVRIIQVGQDTPLRRWTIWWVTDLSYYTDQPVNREQSLNTVNLSEQSKSK